MLISVLTGRAGKLLSDTGATAWTSTSLLDYFNEAVRKIISAKPNAFRQRRTVTLGSGASQNVPSDCLYFFGPTRNMGADGATPGNTIRLVDRQSLIDFSQSWMGDTGTVIKEYALEDPRAVSYLVNPPVSSDEGVVVQIEIELAYAPESFSSVSADISSSDFYVLESYEESLISWMVYRALLEETEDSMNEKSAHYLERFNAGLQ